MEYKFNTAFIKKSRYVGFSAYSCYTLVAGFARVLEHEYKDFLQKYDYFG